MKGRQNRFLVEQQRDGRVFCLALAAGMLAWLSAMTGLSAQPGHLFVASFDSEQIVADRNDWGRVEPITLQNVRLTPPGEGCPTHPAGRALDCGYTEETRQGRVAFALPHNADLRQGTLELWFRPAWGSGARAIYTLFHIKLRGGQWNGLWLGYHGLIGPNSESFGANVMDGMDHPAYTNGRALGWRTGEWHHLAFVWSSRVARVFVDGRLVAEYISQVPFKIHENEGQLSLGKAGGLIDELRFTDVPLYTPAEPPDPQQRPAPELGLGLATARSGAQATADSTASPEGYKADVPELHDGLYGHAVVVGSVSEQPEITVALPVEAEIAAVEWSRDGVPYAGPQGRGWAHVLPYPLAFVIETSLDGTQWEEAYRADPFDLSPALVAQQEALRFRHNFAPRRARFVRLRPLKAPRGDPALLFDEIAVYESQGQNVARREGASVFTQMTAWIQHCDAGFVLDGRWGATSAWRSATPGRGVLTISLPAPTQASRLIFSSNREGLPAAGVPCAGIVEISADGEQWHAVGRIEGTEAGPRTITWPPQEIRAVRLKIEATADGKEPMIDDVRLF